MRFTISPSEKLDEATKILQIAQKIENDSNLIQQQKDIKYASLMTELEGFDIPFFMDQWKVWINDYPNMELWDIYMTISKMRSIG